jgi:hypothetical protein
MASPTTKPSTPRLSDVARHVVAPKGIVSTGWPAIEDKCRELGVRFRWWQKPIGQIILAKRGDGKYASTIGGTGLSIPRQVGKTFLVGMIIFALCLLRPGLTVVWSAHRLRTAEETFKKMQALTRRKRIAPHIAKVILGSGEESIEFTNGSRILFGARAAGFGRGFDEVDVVVYDEAQILGENALDDMIPAMNQCRQETGALLMFMGTPPKPTDPGEIFTRMRQEALSGEDDDTAWIEFGSDPGYEFTPLPAKLTDADWVQIAKANPSFPEDTPREAILRMRKKLGEASFLREGAGIWDEFEKTEQVIAGGSWSRLVIPDETAPDDAPTRYSLTMSPERQAVIGVAIDREDDIFVDLAEMARVDDTRALVEWFVGRKSRRMVVMIDSRDPAAAFANDLRARGVKVNLMGQSDAGKAFVGFTTAVTEGRISHVDQPAVKAGLKIARAKAIGKAGLQEWDLDDPTVEVAAVRAVTHAHYGLSFEKKKSKPQRIVVLS